MDLARHPSGAAVRRHARHACRASQRVHVGTAQHPGTRRERAPGCWVLARLARPRPSNHQERMVGHRDHDATGTASIYRRGDGSAVVALEDIDIEPGPDYRVFVVRGPDGESPGDGTELDGLRGNQGTQYYEVRSDIDPG